MIVFEEKEETKTHFQDSRAIWSSFYDDVKSSGKYDGRGFDPEGESQPIMESWNGLYRDDWDD